MKEKIKNKNGFTLTELIIVIVIIGILAAVLIPSLTKYIERARDSAALQESAPYATALSTYNLEYIAGGYKGTFEEYCSELGLDVTVIVSIDKISVDPIVSTSLSSASASKFKTDGFLFCNRNNRLISYNHLNGIS